MNTKETEAKEKEILISKIQEINKKKRHEEWLRKYKWRGGDYGSREWRSEGANKRKKHPQPQPNLEKEWDRAELAQLQRMSLEGVKQVWERIPKPCPPIIVKTKEEKEKQNEDAFKILNKIIPRINNRNS